MKFNNKKLFLSNILKRNLYHDDCFATQYLKLIYTNPVIHFDTVEVENGLYTTTNLQDCS